MQIRKIIEAVEKAMENRSAAYEAWENQVGQDRDFEERLWRSLNRADERLDAAVLDLDLAIEV